MRRRQGLTVAARITLLSLLFCLTATAQIMERGRKLATAVIGRAAEGQSVAISGDGNTAIVGSPYDGVDIGAAWLFTRAGGAWSSQADKLFGPVATSSNAPLQGWSVALSADGNTVLFGAPGDNAEYGSAWVFMRHGGTWAEQKLVDREPVPGEGWSVALSADGRTAMIGAIGTTDLCCSGAVTIFTRDADAWTQQSDPLTASDGGTMLGTSIALSADGTTALAGDPSVSSGAAYAFVRTGGVWSQQAKLVGAGAVGQALQGISVALSSDGNTAIVGGPGDNAKAGAAWVFRRTGAAWTQVGEKLVGAGATGPANQGFSVSLSGDGNVALIGGPGDDGNAGAAWLFTKVGDAWIQSGRKLVGGGAIGKARQGASAALSGDGKTALIGGPGDNDFAGAAWLYAVPTAGCTPYSTPPRFRSRATVCREGSPPN